MNIQVINFYSKLCMFEEYYYPSMSKSYITQIPINKKGNHFGFHVKALMTALYYNIFEHRTEILNFYICIRFYDTIKLFNIV